MAPAGEAEDSSFVARCSESDVELLEVWGAAYEKEHHGFTLAVKASGGQPKAAELIEGDAQLLVARERFSDCDEVLAAHPKVAVRRTLVAIKGETVIVHPGNPIALLSFEQVRDVFSGTVSNWKDLGGPDQPIEVVIKDGGRTLRIFQDRFLGGEPFAEDALVVADKDDVVREVGERPWAIGFSSLLFSLPAGEAIKLVRISDAPGSSGPSFALVYPTVFCVREDAPQALMAFVDWVATPAAQELIATTRFAPANAVGPVEIGW